MENKKKNCPGCNKEFKLGRSDQIYCNKKCKSSYHNKNNTKNLEIVKKITNLLMKNYKLVLALMGDKKTIEVSGEYLRSIGFLFTVHTHVEYLEDSKDSHWGLYDVYFFETENNNYKFFRV